MYAVGRLGSYITRGVYTVSGPFHPFGGAVDIIVVEQPDGSFKSSPWYVRFGKFQGILKGRENVVTIAVNGVETNIHMYLDPRGEAYFLRESERQEAESLSYLPSSSDEMDEQSPRSRSPMKSKSCNYDGRNSNFGDQVSISNAEIVTQNSSRQSGITGLVLGQRSISADDYQEGGDGAVLVRLNALERSEIAANLVENVILNESDLEAKLVDISEISKSIDEFTSQNADQDKHTDNVIMEVTSNSEFENKLDSFTFEKLNDKQASDEIGILLPGIPVSEEDGGLSRIWSNIYCETSRSSIVQFDGIKEQTENEDELGVFPHKELDEKQATHGREHLLPCFDVSEEKSSSSNIQSIYCKTTESSLIVDGTKEHSESADMLGAFPFKKLDEKQDSDGSEVVNRSSNIQQFSYCETSENSVTGLDSSKEKSESANVLGALSEKLDENQASDGRGLVFPGSGVSEEESGSNVVQSIYCETSENLVTQSDGSKEQSEIADGLGDFHGKKLVGKQASDEREVLLPIFGVSQEESGSRNVMPIDHESYESSIMELKDPKAQSEEILCITSGRPGEIHFGVETLHVTTESIVEDTVNSQANDIELASEEIESLDVYSQQANPSYTATHGNDEANPEESLTISMPCVDPGHGLVEVDSKDINSDFSFRNSVDRIPKEMNIGSKTTRFELLPPLDSVVDPEQHNGKCGSPKAAAILLSESSEEEQFFFSDIDDFELRETQGESNLPDTVEEESNSPDAIVEENHPSICAEGVSVLNRSLKANDQSGSFPSHFARKIGLVDVGNFAETLKLTSTPIDISVRHSVGSAEDGRLTESLPDLWSHMDNLGTEDLNRPLSHSLDLDSEPFQWELHDKDESECVDLDSDDDNLSEQDYSNKEDANHLEDIKKGVSSPAAGDPSKAVVATGGSWRLWPFPFRRSRSRKIVQQPAVKDTIVSDVGEVTDGNIYSNGDKNVLEVKDSKMVKAMTPTSEELASLNLTEGSNSVTFTFCSAMLGKQKVDARIYLWKWNTRIVISDVDGTITKSDVLGQFMPLVGIDWSQTGVAHLFSAIKDNGYQFLYLSARAIAQAYITRNFLVNLKQDGKALPDGPVVISPDGLFPSLYREVIRRAPHEFKIACLEDIRALYPPDCHPFYAGFGNRDTDEISYLKVGIPRGKIFIINPRGEVAVNRLVDTRSYTSLHALVHGMFPPPVMTSSEQEDFNSWNFWKLPPPDIDI